MTRIAGFKEQKTFVEEGVAIVAAAGGNTGLYDGNDANAYYVRFKKNASQAGGSEPIAYFSYDINNTTPDATNAMPIYDGDAFWVWPEELRGASAASSDANQPTAYYALWFLQ